MTSLPDPEVLRVYAGQWVVVHEGRVVAHGSTAVAPVREARDMGIESPYVIYVEPVTAGDTIKLGL